MMEYMLSGIWSANGMNSPLIFHNVINSAFNNRGDSILTTLVSLKLFAVLGYLINQNAKSLTQFLSQQDIMMINHNININNNGNQQQVIQQQQQQPPQQNINIIPPQQISPGLTMQR